MSGTVSPPLKVLGHWTELCGSQARLLGGVRALISTLNWPGHNLVDHLEYDLQLSTNANSFPASPSHSQLKLISFVFVGKDLQPGDHSRHKTPIM